MSQRLASLLAIVGLIVVVLIALAEPALAVAPPTNNLTLWLNPDSLTGYSNNDSVTYWPDSSGNNHNAVDRAGWAPPKFASAANGINNVPAVKFGTTAIDALFIADGATGTSNGLNLTPINLGATAGLTFAVVFKTNENQGGFNYLLGNAAQSMDFGVNGGVMNFDRFNNTGSPPGFGWIEVNGTTTVNNTVTYPGHYVVAMHSNPAGDSNDYINLYADGKLEAGPILAPYNGATDLARIGQGAGGGGPVFNGLISEVLVYSAELSTADRQQLSTYLADRYAVPEPASLALVLGGVAMIFKRRRAA